MEIIELRRGDFIYRGAAGRGMGVLTGSGFCLPCDCADKLADAGDSDQYAEDD